MSHTKTVVVTGFGPFGEHKVNASSVAVQELKKLNLGDDVSLVTEEMPVIYEDIQEIVPSLWKQHQPILLIHVGVSGIAEAITLEELAHNTGYVQRDIKMKTPDTGCCIDGGPDCIISRLDMGAVCEHINQTNCGIQVVTSKDAGRYLCDFSYYLSLSQDCSCAAFVHVPPLGKPYTAKQLAKGLKMIIQCLLNQVVPNKM
ncbi:pyroglutamyl-peptidase 1-like [Saccoglossus kowalevskii]|uniref:Pyroglutamyl-peptidase 1-like n=1 Tax=Saccoglossus kowalevskii TaxID=10224 RepID=A0ABM0GJR6_SACKO|nr:PREDICTED: pyroglutamyl-peptidase 1-like [Saccoglossus kowalevskii]